MLLFSLCEEEQIMKKDILIAVYDKEKDKISQKRIRHEASINKEDLYGIVFIDYSKLCDCSWCYTIQKFVLINLQQFPLLEEVRQAARCPKCGMRTEYGKKERKYKEEKREIVMKKDQEYKKGKQ